MRTVAIGRMAWMLAATVMAVWAMPVSASERYHVLPESTYVVSSLPPCADEPVEVARGRCWGAFRACEEIAFEHERYFVIRDVDGGGFELGGNCLYTITRAAGGDTHRLVVNFGSPGQTRRLDSGEVAYGDGSRIQLRGLIGDACEYVELHLRFERGCIADMDDGSMTGTTDGGVTIDDLLYYLWLFEEGRVEADIDCYSWGCPDCSTASVDDLLYFLHRFEQGC